MKSFKRITMIAIAIFFTALICNLFGWGDDDVVSSNAYNYNAFIGDNNAWNVAASKDTAHAVWYYDMTYDEVWYARSVDNTETWAGHTELSDGVDGDNNNPSIAVVADTVHVTWLNENGSNYAILYIRSTNKGASWGSVDTISDAMDYKTGKPCIRATGSYVYVAWCDYGDAGPTYHDIFFDRSANNGSTWGTDWNLSEVSGYDRASWPSVGVDGANVDVVWQQYDWSNSDYEVYHIRNANNGDPRYWCSIHNVTADSDTNQEYPCVADTVGYIHVVWQNRNQIWSARSTNSGSNWTKRRVDASSNYYQRYPNVAVAGANVHVVWEDWRGGAPDIFHACSFNNGYSWDDHERISADNNLTSDRPSIAAITDNQDSDYRNLYVVWREDTIGAGAYDDALADYDQYEYVVEDEPQGGGGELISGGISDKNGFANLQISPNPMSSQTTIKYVLSNVCSMRIAVYDISGRFVKTLFEGEQNPGSYSLEWDGKNTEGEVQNPGVFFIKAKGFNDTKVIKLK